MSYLEELFDLKDKVILVTGGSRGLGKEMALGFAKAGADVIIASRKFENCEAVAQQIEAETGRSALPYGVHVGRWEELDGLVDAAYERFGRVDVLVNNAGMSPMYESLGDLSEKLFDSVVNLNFKGPFRLSSIIGERMAAGGGGSIINVSSTGSIRPSAGITPYAAAKSALNSMTEGMAQTFGPHVRVNTIMSGQMMTDVAKAWDLEAMRPTVEKLPMRRIGNPEEIVGAAIYLASAASSYTTGATIRVDGGIL